MLLIWQAQLELLILTETLIQGKTERAFLPPPPPQSLVRGKASALHPLCISSGSPSAFSRGCFPFLPNAGNQSLGAKQLVRDSLGWRDGDRSIWDTGHRHPCGTPKGSGEGDLGGLSPSEAAAGGVHPEKRRMQSDRQV